MHDDEEAMDVIHTSNGGASGAPNEGASGGAYNNKYNMRPCMQQGVARDIKSVPLVEPILSIITYHDQRTAMR